MSTNYFHKILFKRENIHKILVVSSNWIGDAILSSPTISIIRKVFPEGWIAVLCQEKLRDIFSGNRDIDIVITYEGKSTNPQELYAISGSLKKKFDMAVVFPNSFKGALIPYLARIPYRLGYNTQLRGMLLTNIIEYDPRFRSLHQAEYYFKITGLFGNYEMCEPELTASEENLQKAREFLEKCGIDDDKKLIVLHPGASKIEKTWHPERYIIIGKELIEKYGAAIVCMGSPLEKELVEGIAGDIGSGAYPCVSQTGIGIHLGLIDTASLFIGGDSGYMHAAAALGTKLIPIFGPGAPFHTRPLCPPSNYRIMNKGLPCQPCKQHFFRECDPSASLKPLCLELITPDEVLQAADELLCVNYDKM